MVELCDFHQGGGGVAVSSTSSARRDEPTITAAKARDVTQVMLGSLGNETGGLKKTVPGMAIDLVAEQR